MFRCSPSCSHPRAAGLPPLRGPGRGALRAVRRAPAPPLLGRPRHWARRSALARIHEPARRFLRCATERRSSGVRRPIDVPPLREAALREVVSRPAEILSARFATDGLAAHIAERTAEESTRTAARCRSSPICSTTFGNAWSSASTASCTCLPRRSISPSSPRICGELGSS
jgi:hypothetical protein